MESMRCPANTRPSRIEDRRCHRGADKANCHAFVQKHIAQKCKRTASGVVFHGRNVTNVFSSAGRLVEKLRAAPYLIDPCWSKVRRAAARLAVLTRLPRRGTWLWSGFSCVGITEENGIDRFDEWLQKSFLETEGLDVRGTSVGIASVFVCDHRVHQPTRA